MKLHTPEIMLSRLRLVVLGTLLILSIYQGLTAVAWADPVVVTIDGNDSGRCFDGIGAAIAFSGPDSSAFCFLLELRKMWTCSIDSEMPERAIAASDPSERMKLRIPSLR